MTKALNVLDSDGPLSHYVGVCLVILSVAAFIVGILLATPKSDYRECIDAGGSWSHKLDQPEHYDSTPKYGEIRNDAHYTDTCTMGKK